MRVFWRAGTVPGHEAPPTNAPALLLKSCVRRRCAVSVTSPKAPRSNLAARNFLDGKWEKPDTARVVPGQVFLIHSEAGGYSTQAGWNPSSPDEVVPVQTVTRMVNALRTRPPTIAFARQCPADDRRAHARVREIAAILTDLQVLEGPGWFWPPVGMTAARHTTNFKRPCPTASLTG